MNAGRLAWGTLLALAVSGCAVGDFITGAPSARSITATHGLLARRCAGCHAVPVPEAMTAAAWEKSLARMKQRMQLPASEWDSLAAMPTGTARH